MDAVPIRPTYVEVNLARLSENLEAIRRKVTPAQVMPVVKANAYGHGLVPVACHLAQHGADRLAVAILEEGIQLRQAGINLPILVMGGIQAEQIPAYLAYDLHLTATTPDNLVEISRAAQTSGRTAGVHLKIDTGMGRLGTRYSMAEQFLTTSLQLPNLRVEGIFSHFANADAADLSHAHLQLERFQEVLRFYERHSLPRPITHMANSGAILQLPESTFDLVRPGIMLYGVYPSAEVRRTVAIVPALTWKTHVVQSKRQPPKHPVSYGSTWQSDREQTILSLPVGYADGYFRLFSNRAQVLVNGRRYPLVGRVCMDQILVNLGDDACLVGAEVVLLGEQGNQCLLADELAGWAQTIGYEILTNISARVPRVYVNAAEGCGGSQ
jgi:alanine racemase